MMNKTLIISGGCFEKDFLIQYLQGKEYNNIIAADRGLIYAEELGIVPDLIVGDFDSSGDRMPELFKDVPVLKFSCDKDDTDTEIAIKEAIKLMCDIEIICAMGRRPDHFLGNIHILKYAADAGLNAVLTGQCGFITLRKTGFSLKKQECREYVSFLPFGGCVRNLILKGFKYNLDGYDLKPGITRCISNEITGETAYVEFDSGMLLVMSTSDV